MRVRLNLATKPMETHRRFLAGAGLSVFAAAIVFLALGWHVYSVRKAAAEIRTRTDKMHQEFAKYLPPGVRVIRIEPKQVGGHVEVKLTVGAINDEAKLNFLHILATSKHFSDVQEQSDVSPGTANNVGGDQRVVQLTTAYSGT